MRFENLPLRLKLLLTAFLPVALVAAGVLIAFRVGITQVREDAVPRQRLVQALGARGFDFLSEVREYLFEGSPGTLEEIAEIRDDLRGDALELRELAATDPRHAAVAERIHSGVEELLAAGAQAVSSRRKLASERPETSDEDEGEGESGSSATLAGELEPAMERLEAAEQGLSAALESELALAEEETKAAFRRFARLTYAAAALGLGLATALALGLGTRVSRPLRAITEASRRFTGGDLTSRAEAAGRDEVGVLAGAFNEMADEQQRLIEELRENLQTLHETQAQLVQSGKMSAVGELAAGVAHELNNPLSAVLTYAVLIRERLDQLPPEVREQLPRLRRQLGLVETAADRCKGIADNLLLFARQEEDEVAPVDLREVLERSFDLLGATLRRHGVRHRLEVAEKLPPLLGNLNQLQQMVVNLATNAQQAMGDDGGTLTLTAEAGPDGGSTLTLADDGPGIPRALQERIFEPFFTTKPPGQGTGLGLSIVYGIVQRHGGRITVDSQEGSGATFSVRLPHADDSPFRDASPSRDASPPRALGSRREGTHRA